MGMWECSSQINFKTKKDEMAEKIEKNPKKKKPYNADFGPLYSQKPRSFQSLQPQTSTRGLGPGLASRSYSSAESFRKVSPLDLCSQAADFLFYALLN